MKLRPTERHSVEVSFELNEAVEWRYLQSFIIDALENWGGQLHPDDELFGSLEKVKVKRIPATKRNSK